MKSNHFNLASVGALVMSWALAAPVHAQAPAPAADPIAACRSEATDAARIACLEREVQALRAERKGDAVPLGLGEPGASTTLARPATPGTTRLPPNPDGATQGPVRSPDLTPVAPPQLGDEQVVQREERRKPKKQRKVEQTRRLEARVVDYAYTASERLLLVLDNGQVWIQLTGDVAKPTLRAGGAYRVTIKRGALSGYRLTIADVTIVVERLK